MPGDHSERLRLFYALWPDAGTRQALAQRQQFLNGRKTHADDLHLTLVFLGERPLEMLPTLKDVLVDLPAFDATLTLDRCGYFKHNKVAWAGMTDVPAELLSLQAELTRSLVRHG